MKLATFNLYQFAASGRCWHEHKESNTYTVSEWEQKQHWVLVRLQEMDADVVGFQEVFSVPELKQLCAQAGYPYFVTVDEPGYREDDPAVCVKSVVALASRLPVQAIRPVEASATIRADLPIPVNFRFSRKPICADIEAPGLGIVGVYVAHLKSKRPNTLDMHYDDATEWRFRVGDTLQRLSRGTVASLTQRGLEATLLYHDVSSRLAMDATQPIVVMGDMNDSQDSIPLAALTMQEHVYNIGGLEPPQWPENVLSWLHDYRLADAFRLAPNMRHSVRPFTKIHRGAGGVLDYILVSNALNPKNPAARAEVSQYTVWNRHLDADGIEDRLQSDHGQVCVELLPCVYQPEHAARVNQRPAHTLRAPAEIRTRQDFVEYAGGVFQSAKHFRQWGSEDKWKNFWSFFFDTEYGWVTSIYGSAPVSELYQKQRHSIEHVIPRDFLDRYLAHKGAPRNIRNGATVNPFNFAPSERGLNAKRSNFNFDLENDRIVRPFHLELHPESFSGTGFDADHEWVIPSRNRGDIARAILYMLLVYEIDELYNRHINTLAHWAKLDSPSPWEIAYNNWVFTRQGIRNPFIDSPENALLLLDNHDLLSSIEYRK
ncbi:endonuclease [Candidatus Thiothrix sp. Deng01]|uniref:Endonuclease n=1 Tax=Candidatus Thiothrix phosphatis TaxID=3112415 RepID=A0ABU6CU41_9GAMM|nr:endonuclease [Candidatus Thiothrix sp. Deng01]MEB4590341.1 endonuclease [Candidatus Thiothrix sp. Deng01]